MKLLCTLAFLTGCLLCNSQSISTLVGARAQGMGYSSASIFDSWSLFNNVAGLAKINQTSASFTYDVHNTLPGANRAAAAFSIPTKYGVVGGGLFRFGDDVYSEGILSAGFSNQFGLAALGLKVNYIQYRAEGFGIKGAFTLNFGGIAELTPKIFVGAYITNINQPKISEDGDRLPTLLTAGIGFKPTDKVFITTELEKNLEYDATWKLGGEYFFHSKFCARTGFNIDPDAAFFGLGFRTTKFLIDYALQHSTIIQFSHQASITYQFKNK